MKINRIKNAKRATRPKQNREGSVIVEAALVIPIIIAIMFGTLEVCAGYYVQESISIAAYEGARFAAREYGRVRGFDEPQFSESEVTDYVTEILTARGVVANPEIVIDLNGKTFETLDVLDPVRVVVSCPSEGNSTFVFGNLANRTLSASVVFAAETALVE
jgi:hypothetical protein